MDIIPIGYRLFLRAASLSPTTEENAHLQLWNKGTEIIVMWCWSIMSTDGTSIAAGPTGSGNPNQVPTDGLAMRLVHDITAFTYSYPNGVDGSAGDPTGLASGPPSALSTHGEIRAQISTNPWQLAQAHIDFASKISTPIVAQRWLKIPPGHGWTVRASVPRAHLAVSFAWLEPIL
jgi:hypothetical protein